MKFLKIFIVVFLFIGLMPSAFSSTYTYAQKKQTVVIKKVATPSPKPSVTPIPSMNSFEVFWPLSSGRVEGDKLYLFKLLKEKIRGKMIFGNAEKFDYKVLLATKRVLESEKLLNDNKVDEAKKTLGRANKQLVEALSIVKLESSINGSNESQNRLTKMSELLNYQSSKFPQIGELNAVKKTVDEMLTEVKN